jgi:hypothetical protein
LNVIKGIGAVHGKANQDDVRIGIAERAETIVVFLTGGIPKRELNTPAIDLYVCDVVFEHGRDVHLFKEKRRQDRVVTVISNWKAIITKSALNQGRQVGWAEQESEKIKVRVSEPRYLPKTYTSVGNESTAPPQAGRDFHRSRRIGGFDLGAQTLSHDVHCTIRGISRR